MADFFDRVKDGVNKGVATVSTGSKNILEKTKLNSVIKTLSDEKKQLVEILGNKVYNYSSQEKKDVPYTEIASICEQITLRETQIAQQKTKIEELDAEMDRITGTTTVGTAACSCGTINKPGSKFCVSCGKKLG